MEVVGIRNKSKDVKNKKEKLHTLEELCVREAERHSWYRTVTNTFTCSGAGVIRHSPVNSSLFYMKVISKQPLCCSIIPKTAHTHRHSFIHGHIQALWQMLSKKLMRAMQYQTKKVISGKVFLFISCSLAIFCFPSFLPASSFSFPSFSP